MESGQTHAHQEQRAEIKGNTAADAHSKAMQGQLTQELTAEW